MVAPRSVVESGEEQEYFSPPEQAGQLSGVPSLQPPPVAVPEAVRQIEPGLVVVGAPDLAVDTLTREQVRAIFLGESVRIPSVGGPLSAVLKKEYGGADGEFYRKVVGKTARQFRIHWAKIRFQGKQLPPQRVVGDKAVKSLVAGTPRMIGIIDSTAVDDSVKVLLRY